MRTGGTLISSAPYAAIAARLSSLMFAGLQKLQAVILIKRV